MKKLLVGLMGAFVLGGTLVAPPAAQSAGSSARISRLSGRVQVRTRVGWRRAYRNQPLYPGMSIRTAGRSRAEVRYHSGSLVRLGSRTVLRVRGGRNVNLLRGKTWIKKQKNKRRMRVKTPTAVASVLGTELFVSHNAEDVSHVTTLNGLVKVENEQGDETLVKPGMWVEIEPDVELEEPTKFDWNSLKKQERFLLDFDFVPPPETKLDEENWK